MFDAPHSGSRLRTAWPWAAALLSGALTTACFPPWNQPWLAWLALAPLTAAVWFAPLRPVSGRFPAWSRAFALGYVAGLVFFWGAFYWLIEVTGIGWFVLAFYMALYPAIWAAFMASVADIDRRAPSPSRYLRSRWNLSAAFLGAAAWTGLEWIRGWMFTGFGWNTLGSAFHADLPLIQIAEWTGVGGLTFLAAFGNLIAVSTIRRFVLEVRVHRIRPHFDFTLTLSAVMILLAWGLHALRATPPESIPLRVAAVQPNIPQPLKWDPTYEGRIFDAFEKLTQIAAAERPQLLLWPEAATPRAVFADEQNFTFVKRMAKLAAGNFLLGTLDYEFGNDGRPIEAYNAALLIPPSGDWQTYRKMHLVPFGEFVPFRHSFPLFAWIVGAQVPEDFAFGQSPVVFETKNPAVRLAPLICFEDTVGRVARAPVQLGAQVLVNITNDGWFGHSAANEQQLNEAVFRTVENRRPMVRCANTGVTAFIDSHGRINRALRTAAGSPFLSGVLGGVVQAPADPRLTFYTRHGEVFSAACLTIAFLTAAWSTFRRTRRSTVSLS